MTTLSRDFGKYTIPGLITKGFHITTTLNAEPGATYFSSLSETFATVHTAIEALQELASRDMTPSNMALRDAKQEEVIDRLQALADDLEEVADGDVTKLAATGYDINKTPERHTTPPGIPQNVRVKTTGIPGEARMSCDALEDNSFYESRCSLSASEGPYIAGSTETSSRKCMFTGLERGKDYYFSMRGKNSVGPGGWSDIAVMMVV